MSKESRIVNMILNCNTKKITPKVLLPATDYVAKQICKHFKVKSYGKTWRGKYNNSLISVVKSMIGAPATAIIIEALKRAKVKYIIRVDYCGGLTEDIKIGDIILCPIAICGDGTTPHYLHSEDDYPQIFADTKLISLIREDLNSTEIDFHEKIVFTHDALFIEPPELIEKAKNNGASVIDMETSIIFVLGKLFNISTASIMVVTDNPGTREILTKEITINHRIFQNLDVIIDCALGVLSSIDDI
ncbi:MAG: nucleoside phosphorylase [Promethearchaeota archaeon]